MNNNDLRKALENLHREAVKLYGTLGYQGQLDWHELGTALQQAEHVLRINEVNDDEQVMENLYRQVEAENRRALGLDDPGDHFMDSGEAILDPDHPCPKCGGTIGHRVNCPDGIAFSS